jgi:glyoxylate reductase
MTKPVVLVDIPLPEFLHQIFAPHCELRPWSVLDGDSAARDPVRGLLTYSHPEITQTQLALVPNLQVVSNYGVGVDHIDLAAAKTLGVPVGNTPGVVDGATADLTMALILGVARNLVTGDHYARGPDFKYYDPGHLLGRDVFGACLGIIGMGRIGKEVAKRARGFDMTVLYHNRTPLGAQADALGAHYVVLQELLKHADFIALNAPLTPQTRNMIGEAELRAMKPEAYLINTARGGVVDQDALLRALTEGWIAGAALDVTEPEPLPRDHPLLGLSNVIITPHLGTSTVDTRRRMGEMTCENLVAGLSGEVLRYPVVG